ncbi:hypothetical protein B0A55_07753 [Friedmanniomyces simplex]|uniref:Extradiol ring-cleavage dioxygenase class III enzyme subunit B domain-containing protein n=1 Tax=Friedmanniomyces simplex TaxID=329884 RepID=A0A4U0X7P7_9PEZI|nr:hypothetical protein B0A55_07753 [Friedmanniomyces simplex]
MALIYDFYGFPPHYYKVEYPNRGSPELAACIVEKLESAGIEVDKTRRGLDHGVWVGFVAAFSPKDNPLDVPIVQVSLYDNEDLNQHYRLGQALEGLRDQGILIIGAGMAVHNLHDFRALRSTGKTGVLPYASTFDKALKDAVTASPKDRQAGMLNLQKRNDFSQAHPSLDHILPMYVAAGAAGLDTGEQLWTLPEGSLNWAQYRFGEGATEAA